MIIPKSDLPRVVVVGGGFAGLALARNLMKQDVQMVLLDRHNYHTFQPLLYQVSTSGLEPDSIAYPLRKITRSSDRCFFRLTEVKSISAEKIPFIPVLVILSTIIWSSRRVQKQISSEMIVLKNMECG